MKLTTENIIQLPIKEKDKMLLYALLSDLKEMKTNLFIDWQDYHNDYSPEWTEPMPDFYGYYTIRYDNSGEILGEEMTIDELNSALFLLYEFEKYVLNNEN